MYKLLLLAFETSASKVATSKCVANVLGALLWRIQCMAYPSLLYWQELTASIFEVQCCVAGMQRNEYARPTFILSNKVLRAASLGGHVI